MMMTGRGLACLWAVYVLCGCSTTGWGDGGVFGDKPPQCDHGYAAVSVYPYEEGTGARGCVVGDLTADLVDATWGGVGTLEDPYGESCPSGVITDASGLPCRVYTVVHLDVQGGERRSFVVGVDGESLEWIAVGMDVRYQLWATLWNQPWNPGVETVMGPVNIEVYRASDGALLMAAVGWAEAEELGQMGALSVEASEDAVCYVDDECYCFGAFPIRVNGTEVVPGRSKEVRVGDLTYSVVHRMGEARSAYCIWYCGVDPMDHYSFSVVLEGL